MRTKVKKVTLQEPDGFALPLFTACILCVVVAGVCFLAIFYMPKVGEDSYAYVVSNKASQQFVDEEGTGLPSSSRFVTMQHNETRAVASALADLKGSMSGVSSGLPPNVMPLPYEEALTSHLEERIQQVDYALMQALWLRSLPATNMRVTKVEQLHYKDEPYRVQYLEIQTGDFVREFMLGLRDSLGVWVDNARLQPANDGVQGVWSIYLGDLETHKLKVYAKNFSLADSNTGRQDKAPLTASGTALKLPPYINFDDNVILPSGHSAAPKLVIVIDDLGESMRVVNRLLALEYPVSFAFWPHGTQTSMGARVAYGQGREILVHQPMEPEGYPKVKPGPEALITGMSAQEIRQRLSRGIASVPYAVGINNHMGSRFTRNQAGINVVVGALRERNLFMLDSLTHGGSVFAKEGRRQGLRTYSRSIFLDVSPTKQKILQQLQRAERIALLTGQSIAIGHPLPETLAALEEWQSLRDRKVQIVRIQDL